MARRYKSLHHNLQPGENVVFHREHRSPRNRNFSKVGKLQKFQRSTRRGWKKLTKSNDFDALGVWQSRKRWKKM